MTKYYQVLNQGAHYGKLILAGETGGTNVFDYEDVFTLEEMGNMVLRVLVMRTIPKHLRTMDVDTLIYLHNSLTIEDKLSTEEFLDLKIYANFTIRYKGKTAKFTKFTEEERKEIISSVLAAIY